MNYYNMSINNSSYYQKIPNKYSDYEPHNLIKQSDKMKKSQNMWDKKIKLLNKCQTAGQCIGGVIGAVLLGYLVVKDGGDFRLGCVGGLTGFCIGSYFGEMIIAMPFILLNF